MIELQYKLVYNHFLISLIQYKQWVWIHGTQKTYFWSLWPKAVKQSFLFIYSYRRCFVGYTLIIKVTTHNITQLQNNKVSTPQDYKYFPFKTKTSGLKEYAISSIYSFANKTIFPHINIKRDKPNIRILWYSVHSGAIFFFFV